MILELLNTHSFLTTILSFLFGVLVTWLFKKYDFKMQYHKEIINRRIVCYENIIRFLDEFTVVSSDNTEGLQYYECMVHNHLFDEVFCENLEKTIKNSVWINKETRNILLRFHNFYDDYKIQIQDDISHEEEMIKHKRSADAEFKRIRNLSCELRLHVVTDLKRLHKLKFSELVENN